MFVAFAGSLGALACDGARCGDVHLVVDGPRSVTLDVLGPDGARTAREVPVVDGTVTVELAMPALLTVRHGDLADTHWLDVRSFHDPKFTQVNLREQGCTLVDAEGLPIAGARTELAVSDADGALPCPPTPGAVPIVWMGGGTHALATYAGGAEVVAPVRRLAGVRQGLLHTPEPLRAKKFGAPEAVIGAWVTPGVYILDTDAPDGIVLEQWEVPEHGPVQRTPLAVEGVALRLEDAPTQWRVTEGAYSSRVDGGTLTVYPLRWPVIVTAKGDGLTARALVETGDHARVLRFRASEAPIGACWPGFRLEAGLVVGGAEPVSPLQAGDVLVALDGVSTVGWSQGFVTARLAERAGDVRLSVLRGGSPVEVVLGPEDPCAGAPDYPREVDRRDLPLEPLPKRVTQAAASTVVLPARCRVRVVADRDGVPIQVLNEGCDDDTFRALRGGLLEAPVPPVKIDGVAVPTQHVREFRLMEAEAPQRGVVRSDRVPAAATPQVPKLEDGED